MAARPSFERVFVGGGLANVLAALATAKARGGAGLAVVERGATLGGNHTWCFHAGDVPEAARPFVDPLVAARWGGYDVAFPGYTRAVDEPYAAITSDRLHEAALDTLRAAGCEVLLGRGATEVGPTHVALDDGTVLSAREVLDARGPERLAPAPRSGHQLFVGLELRVPPGVAPTRPMLMDATVPQEGGFRFVYTLPLAPDRLLVEDTCFSDEPELDVSLFRSRALAYAAVRGWGNDVVREEQGSLAMPLSLTMPAATLPLRLGYGGGYFHPTTGYSLPCAVRVALAVASAAPGALLGPELARLRRAHEGQLTFALLLNRWLFAATPPESRVHVFERFYRLPLDTIRRFYALDTTLIDRARILVGRPPRGVSVPRAMRELGGLLA